MEKIVRILISILLAVVLGLAVFFSVSKDANWKLNNTKEAVSVSTPMTRIANDADKSVYGIYNKMESGGARGSAFIYKVDGDKAYLLTNAHVVEKTRELKVYFRNGSQIDAHLEGADTNFDLAVVSVKRSELPSEAKAIKLSDEEPTRGDDVIAMGTPIDPEFYNTTTRGVVSGVGRAFAKTSSKDKSVYFQDYIQVDAAINHGNSGGPLFNKKGEVIGINTLIRSGSVSSPVSNIALSIPTHIIKEVIPYIERNEVKPIPVLGILVDGIYTLDGKSSVFNIVDKGEAPGNFILEVFPQSAAERAGLKKGDIITEIAGDKNVATTAITRKIMKAKKGETIEFKVSRNGNIQTLSATLDVMAK